MASAKTCCLMVFWLLTFGVQAQDVHFSHMHRVPLHLNPAATGTGRADYRFGGIYRQQWQVVPVPYITFMAFADGRLNRPVLGPGTLGLGLQLLTDEAGDGSMRWVQAALSASYQLELGDYFSLSAGFQGSFDQRSFDWSKLTFDEQFNGDVFDPSASSGEDTQANMLSLFSLATGAQLQLKVPGRRTRLDLGAGIHHLLTPVSSFLDADSIRLSRRYSPYLTGAVEILPRFDLTIRAWWQSQQPYSQLVAGAGVIYHLQTAREREFSLELALLNRFGDALIPQLGIRYRTWEAGLSYDINISGFQKATNRRGGPELYFQYFITRVQAPPVFKACPVF